MVLESPLGSKEMKPVNPEGNQPWVYIGRTNIEAEAPILWPPNAKSQLLEKTLMLGKIEGKRRRGQQRVRWLGSITNQLAWIWENPGRWWRTEEPGVLQCMGWQRQTWLSDSATKANRINAQSVASFPPPVCLPVFPRRHPCWYILLFNSPGKVEELSCWPEEATCWHYWVVIWGARRDLKPNLILQ